MTTESVGMLKFGVRVVTALSVGHTVGQVIQNNVSPVSTASAVKIWCGSLIIGSLVTDAALNHVDATMTRFEAWQASRKDDPKTP